MSRLAKIAALVVFVIVAAGFFYLRVLARRIFVETPVRVEQEARARLSEVVLQSQTGSRRAVRLYFPSYGEGRLAAEVRQMAWPAEDSDRIREILLALIEGSRQGRRTSTSRVKSWPTLLLASKARASPFTRSWIRWRPIFQP